MPEYADMKMTRYVHDELDTPGPTLNSGLAHRILARSPRHAWWGHHRLNPEWKESSSDAFDIGTAAHDLIIDDRSDRIVVINADSWRTKEAKEQREAARAEGKLPLLEEQANAVLAMLAPLREAMASSPDLAGLGKLDPERTLVWQDPLSGAWLRARPDWITTDRSIILSYKTTSASAEPDAYTRTLLNFGYDMQAAFEMNGVEVIHGTAPTHYIWVVQEVQPPYAVSLIGLSPELKAYAQAQFDAAVSRWAQCMANNVWPGYSERVCYPSVPPWVMAQAEELLNAVD